MAIGAGLRSIVSRWARVAFNSLMTTVAGSNKVEDKSESSASKKIKDTVVKAHTYHKMSVDELCRSLDTSPTHGLSSEQANILLIKNGPNVLAQAERKIFLKIIKYLLAGFCWILWIGVIICILAWKPIGDPPDPTNLGLGILLIVVIALQAGFEAFQDWSSTKVMKSIKNLMPSEAVVIRDGQEVKVPVSDVVVGDLVVLNYGSKVPADLRLIESQDLKFDRSMLTGESEAIDGHTACTDERFTESKNVAFMTTMITNGTGRAIVTMTGKQTMIGSIAALTSDAKETKTTLEIEINRFVFLIATLSISTVIICFIVWGAWLHQTYPSYISLSAMLVNVIAILVAFIPTGLPVSLTLSLLLMARKMAHNRVLVKNLKVIETLSCVNVIASDKTGTLTQNKMYVTNACAGTRLLTVSSSSDNTSDKSKSTLQLLNACILCNEARFDEASRVSTRPVNEWLASGGATDVAILRYGASTLPVEQVEARYTILSGIPFNSRNKWMAKVFKRSNTAVAGAVASECCFDLKENECVVAIKGAPDILIQKCKWVLGEDGRPRELNTVEHTKLRDIQTDWSKQGQRVLILCEKKMDVKQASAFSESTAKLEAYLNAIDDYCIVGMVGIIDKPRDNIAQVIRTCRTAGIRVFMVTGDFSITAAAIATQIGIFSSDQYDTLTDMRDKAKAAADAAPLAFDNPALAIENSSKVKQAKKSTASVERGNDLHLRPTAVNGNNKNKSLLLTGVDIDSLDEHEWRIITQYEEIVFARTTPSQKLLVVEQFKKDKNIVAVTGDGVNDSPALKAANVGIAMGGGSEVAMEAAQIVLLDNSFHSVLVAIENGRMVFENLRKVIMYLLPAGSFSEVVPVLLNVFFGIPSPLSAFQMIVICVLTDMGPSLAMMLEKSEGDIMLKPPRVLGRDHLVDRKLLLFAYFFLGVFESFFSNCMFFLYLYMYGGYTPGQVFFAFDQWAPCYHGKFCGDPTGFANLVYTGQTVSFVALVVIQTFGNVFLTRTHYLSLFQSLPFRTKHRNVWIFVAQLVSLAFMILIVFLPPINAIFNTRQIPVEFYFIPLGFCVIFITLDEIRKLLYRRNVGCFAKTAW